MTLLLFLQVLTARDATVHSNRHPEPKSEAKK
jgi:hypothetical protein